LNKLDCREKGRLVLILRSFVASLLTQHLNMTSLLHKCLKRLECATTVIVSLSGKRGGRSIA
jgi:hypothetical protein